MVDIETRAAPQPLNADGARRLNGYAVVFDSPTLIGTFTESIAPGAWTNTGDDVLATWNHNSDNVLGRTRSGTLTLTVDSVGVRYDVDLPDTELGRSVHELVKRGDVYGSSFTFIADAEEWDYSGDIAHRTVTAMRVVELGPVHTPAYPDASVSARAKNGAPVSNDLYANIAAMSASERASFKEYNPGAILTFELREIDAKGEKRSALENARAIEIRSELAELDKKNNDSQQRTTNIMTGNSGLRANDAQAKIRSAGDLLAHALESRGITQGATSKGFSPAQVADGFIDMLAPTSVLLSSGVQRVTIDRESWATPRITSGFTPGFVGELDTLPTGGFGGDLLTVTPKKIAVAETLSSEFVSDSPNNTALNAVSRDMLRRVALGFDQEALSGNNASGDGFVGLVNTGGIQTVTAAEPTDLSPFAEMIGKLESAYAKATTFVMNPARWAALLGITDSTGRQLLSAGAGSGTDGITRSILGVPVYVSPYVDGNTVLAYDKDEVYAVIRHDARFDVDMYGAFYSDGVGVRAIMRANVAVPNPAAVCKLTIAAA
ncbi:phage major capsid protein [Streptomyces diastaticus]|uniref:phage major capsid protein n=1 Tax=Streptomyces diastaticus TaxID=1956 RepID=UPI00380A741A